MRKYLSLFLAVICAFSLVSCAQSLIPEQDVPEETVSENEATTNQEPVSSAVSEETDTTEDPPEQRELTDLTIVPPVVLEIDETLRAEVRSSLVGMSASFAGNYSTLEAMTVAETIVAGAVDRVHLSEDRGDPIVIYELSVSEVFKGEIEAPCRISVIQAGGFVRVESYIAAYGTKGLSQEDIARGYIGSNSLYFGEKMPEIGDEYVLFLSKQETEGDFTGVFYTKAAYHSKYIKDAETGLYARSDIESAHHYDTMVVDEINNTISTTPEMPMSLETIRTRIGAALAAKQQ